MRKMFCFMAALLLLCGCNTVISDNVSPAANEAADAYDLSFSESEEDASYSLNGSTYIALADTDVKISKGGTYILEGTMNDASIIVEVSKDEDVQLVLNNVTISSGDFAGIYIAEGDEITITLADNSVNTISDSGTYTQIDDNDVDALIYSKADLAINGSGTLILSSAYNHGIVSKDDLVITGGNYEIDVAGQALRGKDALMISDGTFEIKAGKDALKSDNDEDEYRGYINITGGDFTISSSQDAIYGLNLVNISGGTFNITTESTDGSSAKGIKSDVSIEISGGTFTIDASDDGIHCDGDLLITGGNFTIDSDDDAIHADSKLQIDDGTFVLRAHEGLEATYVLINGGDISISAEDDGINASQTVAAYKATVEINDGYVRIDMGQGDTDAVDSNGYIYVNGGTLEINAQSAFDYDAGAEKNGGTIIVNGTQTDQITSQMMGGFGGMGGMGGMGHGNGMGSQSPWGSAEENEEGSGGQNEQSDPFVHQGGRH